MIQFKKTSEFDMSLILEEAVKIVGKELHKSLFPPTFTTAQVEQIKLYFKEKLNYVSPLPCDIIMVRYSPLSARLEICVAIVDMFYGNEEVLITATI